MRLHRDRIIGIILGGLRLGNRYNHEKHRFRLARARTHIRTRTHAHTHEGGHARTCTGARPRALGDFCLFSWGYLPPFSGIFAPSLGGFHFPVFVHVFSPRGLGDVCPYFLGMFAPILGDVCPYSWGHLPLF